MFGRTDGATSDVAAAISTRRGSRLGGWLSSTPTVISMGSPWAEPAARGPVTATLVGGGWSEVVQRLHVAGEPHELGLLLHGTRPVPSPVWVYRKDGSVGVEALVAWVGGHPVVGGWDEPVCWVVVYRFLNGDAVGVRVPLGVFNCVCVL